MAEEKVTDDLYLTCKACAVQSLIAAPRHVLLVQWMSVLEGHQCPSCGAAYRLASQDLTWKFKLPGAE